VQIFFGCLLGLSSQSLLALLDDRLAHTLVGWQRYPRLGAFADHEHVRQTRGECVVSSVLDVNNVERTRVSFSRCDDTDATQVVATGDHDQVARVKLDVVLDLAVLQVQSDRVVHFDVRVRVADGTTVVRDDHWDTLGRHQHFLHFAQLVLGLLLADTVHSETTLDVIDETEEFVRLLDGNDIHEASWVGHVGSDLSVDLDQALRANLLGLHVGQRVLETVAQEDNGWQALAQLVWTRAWSRCEHARKLVQHPVLGRIQALQVLPSSTVTHSFSNESLIIYSKYEF